MSRIAVQFGAGNIGRGFLGQLYCEAGLETVFVEADLNLVGALNRGHRYQIRIVETGQVHIISPVRALHISQLDEIRTVIAECDIASTAVGAKALPQVAALLAQTLDRRIESGRPIDIILAENMPFAGKNMRNWVCSALPVDLLSSAGSLIGFVEASVGRMVPLQPLNMNTLEVRVEAFCELPIDAEAVRSDLPPIPSLRPSHNFASYIERKLFMHNGAHAAAAYLGYLRGHGEISEAMQDAWVKATVQEYHAEVGLALSKKWAQPLSDLLAHGADLRRRFGSVALGDQVARVGGDPLRKLAQYDRLAGSLRLCLEQNIAPIAVRRALAAATLYHNESDPSAVSLHQQISSLGVSGFFHSHAGLTDPELQNVTDARNALRLASGLLRL